MASEHGPCQLRLQLQLGSQGCRGFSPHARELFAQAAVFGLLLGRRGYSRRGYSSRGRLLHTLQLFAQAAELGLGGLGGLLSGRQLALLLLGLHSQWCGEQRRSRHSSGRANGLWRHQRRWHLLRVIYLLELRGRNAVDVAQARADAR